MYGFSNDTFYSKLLKQPIVQKLLEDGKNLREAIIRLKQMELVWAGNVKMLIHLGKSELGQTYRNSQNDYKTYNLSETDNQIIESWVTKYM